MNISATKLFAKILVFAAIFSFALACCEPIFTQAAEPNDAHIEVQSEHESHHSAVVIEEGHDCDHENHHGQSSLQAPTQKLTADFTASTAISSPASFYQYPTVDSYFLTHPRITGPPWDGKSIKAFLGVYLS
jgi:hypothetical protein